MSDFAPNILGLDVGARQIGVSVLRGEELVFYAVKTIKGNYKPETLKRLREVLTALVAQYNIEAIALEKIAYPQQHRSFVKVVYKETKEFTVKSGIELFEYNPKLIRQIICSPEKSTKRNTALSLAQKYTELAGYFNVPKLWQKRYYAQLFDAIAVALVCAKELRKAESISVTNSD
jgi:Holliday junction resolvasome RuvABC endonuclease subunit